MSKVKDPAKKQEPVMLQFEDSEGKQVEVDLAEVVKASTMEQLEACGFTTDESGKMRLKELPFEMKDEAEKRLEKAEESANFIKTLLLPENQYKKYNVKQVTTDAGSMGTTVPTALADAILEKKEKFYIMSQDAFRFQAPGPLTLPTEDGGATGYWVGESDYQDDNLVTPSEPTTSSKSFGDHYGAAIVPVSWKLLNTSAYNIENFIATLIGKALAQLQETAFIGGDGVEKPKGIRQETFTEVAQAGATLSYQDLVNLWYSLPPQYRQNAKFYTSSVGAQAINGLVDQQNRPIFQPGQPLDVLFRKDIRESVDIPSNLGSGTDETEIYLGDPFYYWIKEGTGLEMETDKIIDRLQSRVMIYQAVDGKVVLNEAFVKMTGVTAPAAS